MKNWIDILNDNDIRNSCEFNGIYELTLNKIKNYIGDWFIIKDSVKSDEKIMTIISCDPSTCEHLMGYIYNPLSIDIFSLSKINPDGDSSLNSLYNMVVAINSIDDSSFTIWFIDLPLNELIKIRGEIINYVKKQKYHINGEDLLDYCVELGADQESRDYN